jgi:anaerobic selenocysteine-containing dehydrogenase
MHPDMLFQIAQLERDDQLRNADRRRHVHRRPRPPSRLRRQLAAQLVRLAARLTDEPVPAFPRRV